MEQNYRKKLKTKRQKVWVTTNLAFQIVHRQPVINRSSYV